ncbi:hypothetical protein YB2330_000562 [Saitoella coloradoensis]
MTGKSPLEKGGMSNLARALARTRSNSPRSPGASSPRGMEVVEEGLPLDGSAKTVAGDNAEPEPESDEEEILEMHPLPPLHSSSPSQNHGASHSRSMLSLSSSHGSGIQIPGRPRRRSSARSHNTVFPTKLNRTALYVHSLLEVERGGREAHANGFSSSEPGSPKMKAADATNTLSKRELSELALGVRELSKHLGSARMKLRIRNILIVTKDSDHSLVPLTRDVATWLLSQHVLPSSAASASSQHNHSSSSKSKGLNVYVNHQFENSPNFDAAGILAENESYHNRLKFWTPELCARHPHLFDFVVTLGGDGTVLFTSWLFQRVVPPVLSFSLGSLGFLTKFDYADFRETLTNAFNDGVTCSLRMRFECTVMRVRRDPTSNLPLFSTGDIDHDILQHHNRCVDGGGEGVQETHEPTESYSVLNDLVVDRGPNPFMSSTELYGDDQHLTSVQADGLCIATPTGSTAYSLSAGGSLVHPEIPAILISPICAHTLSFRPLQVPDSMTLRIAVPFDSRSTAWCSFDGRKRVELKQGDYVQLSASRFPFPTVLRSKQSQEWFESISRTLNWNDRKKQKSFS